MPVADVAEITSFAEALDVKLNTEVCRLAERRSLSTDIVRLDIGSDLYTIAPSQVGATGR